MMGTCKGCGTEAELNEQGLCATCAASSTPSEGSEGGSETAAM